MRRTLPLLACWLALAISYPLPASTDPSALIQQGQQQLDSGNLEQAKLTFQQAVEQNPESSLGYTRLGGAQVLTQEHRAGIESFQRAISLDQTNADAFVGMALAYIHLGQYTLARESLKEAQRLDPAKKDEIERVLAWIDQRTSESIH